MASSSSNWMKQKAVTVTGAEEEDRISELLDSLLVHILSLLPRTKDAFRTCILSKRWQYLWTSLDTFSFDCTAQEEDDFVTFVDYVLAHSLSPKIKKFQLEFTNYDYYAFNSHINRWLSFAVEKKVEHVVLWYICMGDNSVDPYMLPEYFHTCSSLITLDISSCLFVPDAVILWKSLKSIVLEDLELRDEDIVNLLSGCPSLEIMKLELVWGFSRLEINSLKLKTLKLKDYLSFNDETDHSLEIIAPYVQHLEIVRDLHHLKCRLVDVSSVVNAKLTFNIMCIKDVPDHRFERFDDEEDSCRDYHQVFRNLVPDYLQKLSCATDLTIGTWFTEVLCMLLFKGVPIPELKCKYLTLELHMVKFNLYGTAGLLRASPYVETLIIDMDITHFGGSRCEFESRYLVKGDNIDLQSWISCFVFPNLKNVKIVNSSRVCLKDHFKQGHDKLFKFSEFLLKNATVLEKFIIISKTRKCWSCSMNCVSPYLFRLAGKLLGCPRSSTNSKIIFEE